MPIKSNRKYNSKKKRKYNSKKKRNYNSKKKRKILKGSSRKNENIKLNRETRFYEYKEQKYTMPTDKQWKVDKEFMRPTAWYKNRKLLKYWSWDRKKILKDAKNVREAHKKFCPKFKKHCKEQISASKTTFVHRCCEPLKNICKSNWVCPEITELLYANNQEMFKEIVYEEEDKRAHDLIIKLNIDKTIKYDDNSRNIEYKYNYNRIVRWDKKTDSSPILLNDWDLDFILLNIDSLEITNHNITNIINLLNNIQTKLSSYINKKKVKIIEALTQKINHMNSTGAKNNLHTVNPNLSDSGSISDEFGLNGFDNESNGPVVYLDTLGSDNESNGHVVYLDTYWNETVSDVEV